MAENALDCGTGAQINLGSPSGLDSSTLTTSVAFSLLHLIRLDSATVDGPLATKMSLSPGWGTLSDSGFLGFTRGHATTFLRYRATTAFYGTTGNWVWMCVGYDPAAGPGAKCTFYHGLFGAGSLTDLGVNAIDEPSGALLSDDTQDIVLNREVNFFAAGNDIDWAAFGMVAGKKTKTEFESIIANIQGTTWMGLWGKPTATTGFPLLAGTSANVASGTTSGSPTLATDAPDWYTTAAGGTASAAVIRGRGLNRGFAYTR